MYDEDLGTLMGVIFDCDDCNNTNAPTIHDYEFVRICLSYLGVFFARIGDDVCAGVHYDDCARNYDNCSNADDEDEDAFVRFSPKLLNSPTHISRVSDLLSRTPGLHLVHLRLIYHLSDTAIEAREQTRRLISALNDDERNDPRIYVTMADGELSRGETKKAVKILCNVLSSSCDLPAIYLLAVLLSHYLKLPNLAKSTICDFIENKGISTKFKLPTAGQDTKGESGRWVKAEAKWRDIVCRDTSGNSPPQQKNDPFDETPVFFYQAALLAILTNTPITSLVAGPTNFTRSERTLLKRRFCHFEMRYGGHRNSSSTDKDNDNENDNDNDDDNENDNDSIDGNDSTNIMIRKYFAPDLSDIKYTPSTFTDAPHLQQYTRIPTSLMLKNMESSGIRCANFMLEVSE